MQIKASKDGVVDLTPENQDKIWIPDLFIYNLRNIKLRKGTLMLMIKGIMMMMMMMKMIMMLMMLMAMVRMMMMIILSRKRR